MNHQKFSQQILSTGIVLVLMVGCSTPKSPPSTPAGVLVSPNNSIGVSGYWKSNEGEAFTVSLSDMQGRQAILEVQGEELRWDKEGKLTEGAESSFRIQTNANPEHWYKIIHSEVLDGLLILTAEDGIYTFFTEGRSATSTTRAPAEVTITKDGNWKGQASFILTGFDPMNFSASLYQDTRNYKVQR